VEELEAFLRALAVDARAARDAGPFSQELVDNGILRIRVADVDLSSLALVETGDEETTAPEAGAFASRVVRALLASGVLSSEQVGRWTASGKSHADLLQLLFETGGSGGPAGSARAAALSAAPRAPVPAARLVAVADTWVGIRASSPMGTAEAIGLLRARAGTFLDPAIVEVLAEVVGADPPRGG
jgi:hypothetical protein